MDVRPLLNLVLHDEALTRGLGDAEARVLVEWLTDSIETIAEHQQTEREVYESIRRLCLRGRAIRRFVSLWCHEGNHGAAVQLAATERFQWALPDDHIDPWLLMHRIVAFESQLSLMASQPIVSN